MSDIQTSITVHPDLKAINVIQSEDWVKLAIFVDHAITFNVTNETQLRIQASMQPSDPIPPDVKQTVVLYQRLDKACRTWITNTYPGTSELAREIIRHKDDSATIYEAVMETIRDAVPNSTLKEAQAELSRQWQSGHPSAEAQDARTKIARYIERLWGEAGRRQTLAENLVKQIGDFQDELGACDKDFDAQSQAYEKNFGTENEEIKTLKGLVKQYQADLDRLRKKESDEVLVLETAPSYLVIPFPFGEIIMMGVLIGVGADLAKVRGDIESLLPKLKQASVTLTTDAVFLQYHTWAKDSTQKAYASGEAVRPTLQRIKAAWANITSDLKDLHTRLLDSAKKDALAGDWAFAKIDFQDAQSEWERLANEAAGYLQYQLVPAQGTKEIGKAMEGIVLKAA